MYLSSLPEKEKNIMNISNFYGEAEILYLSEAVEKSDSCNLAFTCVEIFVYEQLTRHLAGTEGFATTVL